MIDDTAGYHARHTEWWWSAGVGEEPDGAALAWNLVSAASTIRRSGSERAVWVAGDPREAPPVSFAADLSTDLAARTARELRFTAEAERSRRRTC